MTVRECVPNLMAKQALLFGLIAALACVLGFATFDATQSINVVTHTGYAFMLLTHGLFAWYLWASLGEDRGSWCGRLKRHWRVVLMLVAAAAFLHVQERHEFKIVADELVIGNTAMQMHFERDSALALRAYDYAGNFTTFTSALDKRPLAFPFLLATVHDLTGYRVENVFWLNGVISLVLVALTWLITRRLGGPKAGYASVLLLCGVPLLAQNATGAGFEVYNMMMIMLTLWLGMRYAERPDRIRQAAFLLSGILLAQVRYESALFILPVGAVVLWVWWRDRRPDFGLVLLAAPLLLLLIPWQHNVFKLKSTSWQLGDVAGATSPFGLHYFYDNIGHALNFFFSFGGKQPSSWLLALVGMVMTGFAILAIYREHREMAKTEPGRTVAAIFIGGLVLHAFLMLCYFWGKWDDPVIRRLSLPTHLLFVICVAFAWSRVFRSRRAWDALIIASCLHLALFAAPAMARHVYTQENFAAATCNWISDFIKSNSKGTAVSIDDHGGHVWFLHRKANINPDRFSITWEGYATHFEERSFGEYYVVQRIMVDQTTGERSVSLKDDFGGGLLLETLAERTFAPFYVMRISRVTGVDREKLAAWAKARNEGRAKAKAAGLKESWVAEPVRDESIARWLKALP